MSAIKSLRVSKHFLTHSPLGKTSTVCPVMMREFRKGRKVAEQGWGLLPGDTGRITKESGYFTHVVKDRHVATGHSGQRMDLCPSPALWTLTVKQEEGAN